MLPDNCDEEGLKQIIPVVQERLHRLPDVAEKTRWFFGEPDEYSGIDMTPPKSALPDVIPTLEATIEALSGLANWDLATIEGALEGVLRELPIKKPQLFMPLRIALTGRKDSPGIYEVLDVLGRERSIERIVRGKALVAKALSE